MYPTWGNYGAPQSQNYGGAGPRKPLAGSHTGQAPGFGGFEASSSGSLFSSLQEQHLQQMQQLQMLHQKQLQSVLQHGNNASTAAPAYGVAHAGGYVGSSWRPEGPAHVDSGAGAQSYFKPEETSATRVPPAPKQGHQQPPPLPPQPHPTDTQPVPPPPEPQPSKPPENSSPPKPKEAPTAEDEKSLPLQEQQQLWYKQHLQNLQKLKQERAKQNQKDGDGSFPLPPPPGKTAPPPPPLEPPKSTPPPPPPKEEPPTPPPLPEEVRPEVPKDPEEAARLQQLQAAAAHWQQVQQQRAGLQYQALMQQHEKLQQILEQYQRLIQQPANLQSMSAELQLRHYEMQQQQFTPLFQDWNHSFTLWYEQFQSYPHKDQLQDYGHQWKQWKEQMNATNAHLQERVATLTAMVPFASSQYNSGMMGQYGQYPVQDTPLQQSVNPGMQQTPVTVGPRLQGPQPTGFVTHSESPAVPSVRGSAPSGIGVQPPVPPVVQPPSFNNVRGPQVNNPRFEQPHQRFDGPPRFDQPQQRFDGPPRFDHPQQRFDGPPRFDQPPNRFDGPPRFDQPRHRFDGPPRFDQQRQRFDGPARFDQPRFGQPPRFDSTRLTGPSPRLECPPNLQEKQQQGMLPKVEPVTPQPPTPDSKTPEKSSDKPLSENEKDKLKLVDKSASEDMTDDNLLSTEGFFVQSEPIPQTLQTDTKPEDSNSSVTLDKGEKSEPVNSKPPVNTSSAVTSNTTTQNSQKPDGPLGNSKPPQIPKSSGIQPEPQKQSKLDPPKPPPGRGRGQPPVPSQVRGRGRGQRSSGEFKGQNTVPIGEEMGEMPYDYMPPEENVGMQEEQENYYWQDPSHEQFGGEESEMPPEEMWMPEEHHFTEEEYYQEPIGGPHMGRGRPPMMRGRPPMPRGGPPMGRGGPPMGRGGPPMGRGGPLMGRGGPPMGRGGPPMGRGGPPMGRGGPPMVRGGPPMVRGGPPMGRGGPPMSRGGPPMARGGPPMARGGPPMGRGLPMGRGGPPMGKEEPVDRHWEEAESNEYLEDEDPYWIERRPPMRGMRPPFPPGRGRPPRGHPGFMLQGRGRPHFPPHGPIDHEPLGHGMESDDSNMDPSMHPMYHGHEPPSHAMHPDVGRGRRRVPPPPHEMIDHLEEPIYDEGTEGELDWQPPPGRGPPPPPHEILDREGLRRRPMGRGIGRGMWPPGPTHEDYEEGYKEGYAVDYDHGEDGYRCRPPPDYHPDDCRRDARYHESEWDREHALSERDYPPRKAPSEPFREPHWQEERERGHPYQYDELERGRGELRIREYRDEPPYRKDETSYPPPSDWERPSRRPPLPERGYPIDYEDRRPRYEEQREEIPLHIPPPTAAPVTNLPESSVEAASGANVLALSQRQHEIILKAAQELKLIRELQEGKTSGSESKPAQTDVLPDLPAGLLGLEIPPEVRNALKGMTATTQTTAAESVPRDIKSTATHYQPSFPAPAVPVIPKTVDYGHGHEPGTTVERISYGERIVLRPDPVPSDRGYEKEPLRDPYGRDSYYERRSDPYMDRREYSRERELYREKPEYERERFDRERYPLRERDDSTQAMNDERSPLASSLRSGYRERDRDVRDRDRSGSRDPDEHYGRPGYDRPPYERAILERTGPERYSHSPSPYMDRRSYPDDRGPPTAPPVPPPQPPPRVEKKPEIKNIDDILKLPGRLSRPERIVIIMRGLPGSGKTHVAKLIRDKEVECGGAPPRVLVLDDYFMTEVEKVEKDPDTGKRVKKKAMEYEYELEMEDTYRSSMLKTFKKTLDDGFFPFIILDTINDRVKHFDQFWSAAKTKGFEVYLAEITADTQTCAKRNVHGRTLKDIMKMSNNWEPSPRHMVRLDVRSLLQDAAIEEVEMEDFNPDDEPKEPKREEEEESDLGYIPKSKWEMDTSEAKLDKLDGLGSGGKRKREGEHMAGLEDYLQLPDDYATRMSEPGKKRVRWADLEEQKDADRKRAIGFVVGQTDWEKITDESGQLAQRALNRTKYF
nr:YLP motif-containing protein 1 isoform X3 [Maylandia zebra]